MANITVIHGIHGDRISVGPRRPECIHVVRVRHPSLKHRCIGVWALNITFSAKVAVEIACSMYTVASLACEGPTESRNRLLGSSCRWPVSAAPSSSPMTESSRLATIPTDTFSKIHFSSLCCSLDTSDSADASSFEQADCLAPFPRLVGVLEPILKIFADRF